MQKKVSIFLITAIAVPCLQAASLTWDGDGGNSVWGNAANWSGNTVPTSTDDVTIDDHTNLRGTGNFILDITTLEEVGSVTIDPQWPGGAFALRGDGILEVANGGNITFTADYADNSAVTVAPDTSGNLIIRPALNNNSYSWINDSSTTVSLAGSGGNVLIFGGRSGSEAVKFDGSGNFSLGVNVDFSIERVWTENSFTGVLALNGDVNFAAPGTDLRIQGGTIKIAADEQIGDSTLFAFGSDNGISGTLDARGITETAGILNNFSDPAANLSVLVDAYTDLTFADFNDGGITRGVIDVQGWSEGNSSMIFSSLSGYDWSTGEGEAFVGLTLDGAEAYMTSVPGGWAVTAGGSEWIITGPESLSGNNLIADETSVSMISGALDLNGYSDTVGPLQISDDSKLMLNGGSIAFAASATLSWNGWLDIVGELGDTSVRFGTDANGLTDEQLGWIRHGGAKVYLDEYGYLRRVQEVSTHSYVGGADAFGYTQVLEDFDWNTAPSPMLSGGISSLTGGSDGTGLFAIDAAASDPAIAFTGSPYTFEPDAFPYMRIHYRSSTNGTLTFWPSPNNPINQNSTAVAAHESNFTEYCGRFLSLAMTDPADASVLDPWDSNGLRIDPLTSGTGSSETFELDYVMVDAFATLGLGEFNRDPDPWMRSNVSGVITDAERLTGIAGIASTNRSISRSLNLTNSLYNALEIRVMRESGSEGLMRLRWYAQDIGWFTAEWQPESDGQYYSYMIDLSGCTEWRDNISTGILIDLFDASSANSGKAYGVDYIRLRNLPELGGGIIHEEVNWGTLLNERFKPDYDYVLSKLRYFRSAAGQASNNGWSGNVPQSARRNQFEVAIDGRQPWWKEDAVDSDGDGTHDFEWVTRDTNGVPSVEAAAEAFFQEIKTIARKMRTLNTPDDAKYLYSIFPDNALAELMFPNQNKNIGGGFYEVVYRQYNGGNFDEKATLTSNDYNVAYIPEAQAMAADCFVAMMQKLKADPVTRDVKVYCFNALHVWGWNEAVPQREHSNNESDPGYLEDMLDTLLAADATAFPAGDSPLAGFAQDFPWQYYRAFHHSRKKLNEYMDYAQSRGYRYAVTCNGEHNVADPRRQGYEAAWRYMRRMIGNGARPDEVHAYFWQDYFDGDYETSLLTEHEDADYTYMAALRRTHDQIAYGLPPARPEEVYAAFDGNDVVVSWQENQEYDLLGYRIRRASSSAGPYTTITASPISDTSYVDRTTMSNETYYYQVIGMLEDSDTAIRSTGLPSLPARAVTVSTEVLAEDDFDDQSNPGWFTHINTPTVVPDGSGYALRTEYQSDGNGANWLRYFTPSGSPAELHPGDILTIDWQAKQSAYNAVGNTYLRIALLNSQGTRIDSDTAFSSPVFTNYTGYMIAFGDITAFAHSTFQRRTAPNNQLTDTAAYTGIQGIFALNTIPPNEWTPTQRIILLRLSDGWQITTELGGGNTTSAARTVQRIVETDAETAFDTLLLRYSGGDPGMEYRIDNFTVTLKSRTATAMSPLEEWMQQYGITDPDGNEDEDTFSNLDEWLAGTDPTNSASYFQITDYADGAVTFTGAASRTYVLSFTTNLTHTFVPILTNSTGPEFSGPVSLTDTVHHVESEGFYKIEVSEP